jgi:hypothetical protein
MAFLLCAIGIPFYLEFYAAATQAVPLVRACALASCFTGLSFAANFSFGIVDAATMLLIFAWASRRATQRKQIAGLLAASLAPALLITLCLSAPVLMGLHKKDFYFGATSLSETLHTVIGSSLYELNADIVNPLLFGPLSHIRKYLLPLLGILCVVQFILLYFERGARAHRVAAVGAYLAGIVALTLTAHWLAFHLAGLLLPKERTAIYFVPLAMLIAGVLAAISTASRSARIGRIALITVLYVMATYFLCCLRLSYFKEWRYDADVKNVYSVLAYYNHTYNLRNIASNWRYTSSLNFYGRLSERETLPEFVTSDPYPLDRPAYVLFGPADKAFIEEQKLKVVYRGDLSDVVVAIRPEAERQPR